jgi:hypothetical protein
MDVVTNGPLFTVFQNGVFALIFSDLDVRLWLNLDVCAFGSQIRVLLHPPLKLNADYRPLACHPRKASSGLFVVFDPLDVILRLSHRKRPRLWKALLKGSWIPGRFTLPSALESIVC